MFLLKKIKRLKLVSISSVGYIFRQLEKANSKSGQKGTLVFDDFSL